MVIRTRSARHQKSHDTVRLSVKEVLPLATAFMVIAPLAIQGTTQTVFSDELGESQANQLINQIGNPAAQVAAQNNLYASVMIAQAILESGNGTSQLSKAPNFNLFGVKAHNGESAVWLPTKEYLNGQWHTITEPFKKYDSYYLSLVDHAKVLIAENPKTGTSRYSGAWKSNTVDYAQATAFLTGRYATDPSYAQKLNSIIEKYQLTRFDSGKSVANPTTQFVQQKQVQKKATSDSMTYTVVKGDTLWGIAQKYGKSVDQIISQNHLSGELIVVGQELSI